MANYSHVFLMLRDKQTGSGRLLRGAVRKKPEELESRCLLNTGPIEFGAVYTEQDLGSDSSADTIEISFIGGAPGTQLERVEINSDQLSPGLSLTDLLFDTSANGLGADLPFAGLIADRRGDFTGEIIVEDGSSKLVLLLDGFQAGDRLTLTIDVDEVQGFDPTETDLTLINEELDPIASGAEFQGSMLTSFFSAPYYHNAEKTVEFRNLYDKNFASTELDLPRDDEGGKRDRTAGAIGNATQTPLPIQISGRVYEDENANLQQDVDDRGIPNVAVSLYRLDGNEYSFTGFATKTNGSGDYLFDESLGLLPGTYQIRETQPDDYFSVGATVGFVDGELVGEIASDDVLSKVTIVHGGTEGIEYNFAEAKPASLRGRIQLSTPTGDCWSDDVDHQPVVGARVMLLNSFGETIAETSSDTDGEYEFLGLRPGQYSIVEITPESLIEGGARPGEVDGSTRGVVEEGRIEKIELTSGDNGEDFDFCEHVPAEIHGNVYHDRDNDGVREPGEEGIASALLSLLDEEGSIVDTTATDADGQYEFLGVRAGNYRIIQLQPDGWLDGIDHAGQINGKTVGRAINPGDEIEQVMVLWGDMGIDYDFGELLPSSLEGRVHLSTPDGDCFDVAEELLEPVAGAIVQLLDATGQVMAEAETDAEGRYFFGDLAPGEYAIRETTPIGLIDGGANPGTVGAEPRGSSTDAGDIVGIRLGSAETGFDYDFCEFKPASISGFVYGDDDNDGLREPGEPPIAGVTVQLFDGLGIRIAETTTDTNGKYAFDGLGPGKYSLRQIQPGGWLDGTDAPGTVDGQTRGVAKNPGDEIFDVQLRWGESGIDYNFAELKPATLSGLVHASTASDCWNDESAEPIAGVRIWLLNAQGTSIAETFTDRNGRYEFESLPPGEYAVRQEQPESFFQGTQRAGSAGGDASADNLITSVTISAGQELVDYDFCELPPATISGFVFQDGRPVELQPGERLPIDVSTVRDGTLTGDDRRLAGVTLELREGITGTPIDGTAALPGAYPHGPIRTTTDASGYYEFSDLSKGNYAVYEIQPEGIEDGVDTAGTTNGIAINPTPPGEDDIEILTVVSMLTAPPNNDAIVRIALPPGIHSQSNNFSEVMTTERIITPPLNPPPPTPFQPRTPLPTPDLYTKFTALEAPPQRAISFPADGSASVRGNTWHLSIIDGGQPRMAEEADEFSYLFPAAMWHPDKLHEGRWLIDMTGADARETFFFGLANGTPIAGDFNGDGASEIGIFIKGHWFIDLNANGQWDGKDLWAKLGTEDDLPVTGDWDGDGKDDIGIFGRARPGDPRAVAHEPGLPDMDNVPTGEQKNMPPREEEATKEQRVMKLTAKGRIRADLIDHVFLYGTAGDRPVAGDWNGDGIDTPGVFRNGNWRLDVDGNGRVTELDEDVQFGQSGDMPLVGDFDGDGIDDLAIFRNGIVYIDSNGNRRLDSNDLIIERQDDDDGMPVVGKWSGEAHDRIGWYQRVDGDNIVIAQRTEK